MMKRFFFFIFIFFSLTCVLFARGQAEEDELETLNDEWVLCITEFDTSELAIERRAVAGVIMRRFVDIFNTINYRTRENQEYNYYEDFAWSNSRSNAARSLAAKQNERALLLYRGEPDWRYRSNLAGLDSEIERLREAFEEIDNNAPIINKEPVFNLTSGNMEYQFPSAPVDGNEYRFCTTQRVDGMLTGSISEYHGRFLITMKLYTVYARSFIWEDRILFSHGDIDIAIEEITRKLLLLLSGDAPAAVTISTQPQDALVLINRSFAGKGETEQLEFPPGTITVTASAPDYESMTFETTLVSGELSQININLKPVGYGELEITGNHKGLSGNIYNGAMYIGEAPLTLSLPVNYMEYIEIESVNGEVGRVIFQMPYDEGFSGSIPINTRKPPRDGQVDRARRMFYWSFGATWIAGIAAWISHYSYGSMVTAYNRGGRDNPKFYNDTIRMQRISNGTLAAVCVLGVLDVILITRYIYVANKGSTKVRTGR